MWHELGLLMGSICMGCQPATCRVCLPARRMTSSPALLLCGATLSGRHGLQNRIERRALGSRGREAAAKLRKTRCRQGAGTRGMRLECSDAGALPQAERRAPFERRSSMTSM